MMKKAWKIVVLSGLENTSNDLCSITYRLITKILGANCTMNAIVRIDVQITNPLTSRTKIGGEKNTIDKALYKKGIV